MLAFGNAGILGPLHDAGISLARLDEAEQARVVLVGADPAFTYEKLIGACRAVWNGAALLVTSMAPWFASRQGRMPSTSGAIAAGITHVTGVEPIVVGKPSGVAMAVLAERLLLRPREIAVIGDDLHLEMRMAREAGCLSVLVLTGTTRALADGDERPDIVVASLAELIEP